MSNEIMQENTPFVECSAFHRGMSVLEASLRNTEDSEAIISGLLKGAAEFYGASRASVVEADWDLGIGVITYEWCKDGVPAQRDMLQCLPMEKFPRWRKALRANKAVVISDLQRLEKVYPDEAAFFREYGVTTLLAAPFSKRINQGFIAVDDPTRYTDDPVFLFIASYAVVVELNEIKQQQSLLAATKASKYNPEDIHVNFFGGMEIISSKGTLTGEDIKADQCYLLLAYLILNHKKNFTVDTLAEIICPYDELDSPYKVVNNIVYRLRRTLSVIGLDKLVIGKNGTFQINPNFNIHTDFDRFEDACIQLKTEENPDMRHSLYHSAVDMYKGQLLPRCEHELWLMQLSMYYQSLYLQITVNVSSELITAIYAAFAQKESESISGNMQWSYQRRMESGEFNTCKAPWGFRLDGRKLKICEPEADIVQRIFREYLSGKNPQEIADDLNASCLTERVWNYKAVDYILQNERYAGNALLQKRYTPDMLSRQQKTNHGEREMYFVPGSNDAIISPEIFKRAQGLRQKRSLGKAPVHSEIISQIRCICGARMRFKNVNSKWYLCCTSHDTKGDCLITPIRETQIHASFCRLYYKLKHQSIPILEQMLTSLQLIRNRRMLWSPDIVALNKRISDISSQNQTLAFLKQQGLVDPDIFIAKTNELTKQLRQAKLEKEKLMDAESDMTALQTQDLIDLLEGGPEFLDSFDAELFGELVEKIITESNDSVRFCLKNGLELRESIERTVR